MDVVLFQLKSDGSLEQLVEVANPKTKIVIGRKPKSEAKMHTDPAVTFIYISDPTVSSTHCTLLCSGTTVEVSDSSHNGSEVIFKGQQHEIHNSNYYCNEFDADPIQIKIRSKQNGYLVKLQKGAPQKPAPANSPTEVLNSPNKTAGLVSPGTEDLDVKAEARQKIVSPEKKQPTPKAKPQKKESPAKCRKQSPRASKKVAKQEDASDGIVD